MSDVAKASQGAVQGIRPAESLRMYLASRAEESETVRGSDVMDQQLDAMLAAETPEDIWEADSGGTIAGQNFTDVPIRITGYSVVKGGEQFAAPLGVYILITATVLDGANAEGADTGDTVTLNTGAPLIIGKLRVLEANGLLPVDCFIKGTKTPNGTVLKLRPYQVKTVRSGK